MRLAVFVRALALRRPTFLPHTTAPNTAMTSISNPNAQAADPVVLSWRAQAGVQWSVQHLMQNPQMAVHAQANLNLSDVLKLLRH